MERLTVAHFVVPSVLFVLLLVVSTLFELRFRNLAHTRLLTWEEKMASVRRYRLVGLLFAVLTASAVGWGLWVGTLAPRIPR